MTFATRMMMIGICGLALLAAGGQARGAGIIGGSALLDAAAASQLESWLGQGPITLTNIFAKTPGATAADFHAAVDGRGATFAVMRATDGGISAIVGGYNPQSWHSDDYYNITVNAAAQTGFIFNLTASLLRTQADYYQTLNNSNYGPTFGAGNDIYVDGQLNSGASYGYSYGGPAALSLSIVTGQVWAGNDFGIGELEIFTISAASPTRIPEPFSLALFGAGLAGLGLFARRRAA